MKITLQEAMDRAARKVGLVPYGVNVHPKPTRQTRPSKGGKARSRIPRAVNVAHGGRIPMKLTVQEMFIRAAEEVGLGVYRAGAMLIFSPKKARPARPTRAGKNGSKTR